MQQRLPSRLDPPLAFAHRGARAHAPENTISAFQLARKLGATALESDVWITADGEAVLDHDGVVKSGLRKRPIAELPRAALPAHIPTLQEMLEACGTDLPLSLDIKDEAAASVVIAVVREVDPAFEEHLWLCHWNWKVLVELRPTTSAKLVHSTRFTRIQDGPERAIARLREHGIDALNMHVTDWNGGLVTLAHRFERYALGWDAQFDHQIRSLLRMGIDGVFSDWVDRMMDVHREEIGAGP